MSDAWHELPLSRRRAADDESGVSSDWRPRTIDALRALAAVVDPLTAAERAVPSLRPRSPRFPADLLSIDETLGLLLMELDAGPVDRLLRRSVAESVDRAPERLREKADSLAARTRRGPLHPLSLVVTASADVTVPLGLADPMASLSSGAVALAWAAAAPVAIRSVLQGRSIVPDDAGWSLGRGPAIRGRSAELVAWLAGRDVVPRFDPRR